MFPQKKQGIDVADNKRRPELAFPRGIQNLHKTQKVFFKRGFGAAKRNRAHGGVVSCIVLQRQLPDEVRHHHRVDPDADPDKGLVGRGFQNLIGRGHVHGGDEEVSAAVGINARAGRRHLAALQHQCNRRLIHRTRARSRAAVAHGEKEPVNRGFDLRTGFVRRVLHHKAPDLIDDRGSAFRHFSAPKKPLLLHIVFSRRDSGKSHFLTKNQQNIVFTNHQGPYLLAYKATVRFCN